MAQTKIEWTDAVWNSNTTYYGRKFNEVRWHPDRLDQPLRWTKPRRIFVNSMSDLFHEDLPMLLQVFSIVAIACKHAFMVLTKRPKRMLAYMSDPARRGEIARWRSTGGMYRAHVVAEGFEERISWPIPNLLLGVSVENQATADERIPLLLQTPAAMRFISAEPLLELVHIELYLEKITHSKHDSGRNGRTWIDRGLDWIIAGGESGLGARPMHPDWVRSLRDQCQTVGTKFFFKQWGEWTTEFPQDLSLANRAETYQHGKHFYRIGKKKAGRILDGRTWDEIPVSSDYKNRRENLGYLIRG